MSDSSDSNTSTTTTTLAPEELHTLLSNFQYIVLCLVVLCFYYMALFVSAVAVGESTNSLMVPINLVKHVCVGLGTTVMKAINRRRNRVHVGVTYEEVEGEGDFIAFNQPPPGVVE